MPIAGHDVLMGYRFEVHTQQVPVVDGDHQIHDANGTPKTVAQTLLILIDQETGQHRVDIPLSDEARRELARQLAGGLILAGTTP